MGMKYDNIKSLTKLYHRFRVTEIVSILRRPTCFGDMQMCCCRLLFLLYCKHMSGNISDTIKFQLQQVWSHIVAVQTDDSHLLKNSC